MKTIYKVFNVLKNIFSAIILSMPFALFIVFCIIFNVIYAIFGRKQNKSIDGKK